MNIQPYFAIDIEPYFAIDIETTGLDPKIDQILEIAAVYDDGVTEVENLSTFSCLVIQERYEGSAFALAMNSEILKEISKLKQYRSEREAIILLRSFILNIEENSKVTFAGKNLANFDLKFLNKRDELRGLYSHRIIDVGSIYYPKFGYVPSLQEINDLIGYKPVSHRALDDSLNVVVAIREAMKK